MYRITLTTSASGKGTWRADLATVLKGNVPYKRTVSGSETEASAGTITNNRMELVAVLGGLLAIKTPSLVEVYTKSQYVRDGATLYLPGWERNGWRTASKGRVANQDLWEMLSLELKRHKRVVFHLQRDSALGHYAAMSYRQITNLSRAAR